MLGTSSERCISVSLGPVGRQEIGIVAGSVQRHDEPILRLRRKIDLVLALPHRLKIMGLRFQTDALGGENVFLVVDVLEKVNELVEQSVPGDRVLVAQADPVLEVVERAATRVECPSSFFEDTCVSDDQNSCCSSSSDMIVTSGKSSPDFGTPRR
jgi:hypothetical protein